MSAEPDVALVLLPPFIPDEPHLGLAYLASYLKAHAFRVTVHDLAVRTFHAAPEEQRHYWDRAGSTAERWQKRETVQRFLEQFGPQLEQDLQRILDAAPTVVGFSCHMTNSVLTMEMVRRLRRPAPGGPVVVAGGPAFFVDRIDRVDGPGPTDGSEGDFRLCMYGYPTLGQQELREHLDGWLLNLDAVVLDEGEAPLLEICQRAREGRAIDGVPNTVRLLEPGRYAPLRREPPIREISTIPFPTFEEFDLELYTHRQLPTLFNRGCIKKCTCCTERYRWGSFRARKAEEILAELKHHVEALGVNKFNACDMLLNANVRELDRLCEMIADEGLNIVWGGNVVVRKEMSPELFHKMRRAGVGWLIFGIESGSPKIVERIGKRFTLDEAERNMAACHRAGIRTYINIIIGFPGETEEDFQHTVEFVRRNRDNIDWIILMAMFEIFHHTEVALQPEKYDLRPEDVKDLDEMFGLVDWSDLTGNTYEVRQRRFARMMRVLAELGLPDPTMQGDDLRRGRVKQTLIQHEALRDIVRRALDLDTTLDTPLHEVLEGLLRDEDPALRGGAARMLGMLENRRAVPTLHESLHDPEDWVRGEVAIALGRICDPASVDHLEPILQDERFATLDERVQHGLARLRRVYRAVQIERGLAGPHEKKPEGE
jgi:radical SAM superfamily enzyme YgiQ (UPF0313 family)